MTKSKILNLFVVILIITNLVALGFFFIGKRQNGPMHKRVNPKEIIIKELQFNKEQIAQFELLVTEHRSQMDKYKSEIGQAKNRLFIGLTDSSINSDSLIKQVNLTQLHIENIQFNHFKSIKKLCLPGQMEDFIKLSKKLSHLFSPPGRPRDQRKKH